MRTNNHTYGERAFWVKGEEAQRVKDRRLTVIIRLGDRSSQDLVPKQWLPLLQPVPVYTLVLGTGDQARGIDPDFEPDNGTTVQVVRRTVTRLCDVKDADLQYGKGSSVPGCAAGVADYLSHEMSPGKRFDLDTLLTLYWIEYLPNESPATD